MKNKNNFSIAEKVKSKPFMFWDMVIYVILTLFVAIIFLSSFLIKSPNAQGFKVEIQGVCVLEHVYGSSDFNVNPEWTEKIEITSNDEKYYVKILTDNLSYNTLVCNENEKTVKMQSSNCPSKNCVFMQEIKNSGVIFCSPRNLKITPLFDNTSIPPVTGGVG